MTHPGTANVVFCRLRALHWPSEPDRPQVFLALETIRPRSESSRRRDDRYAALRGIARAQLATRLAPRSTVATHE